MSNNKFTLEVIITDVNSLLKENPPAKRKSESVVKRGLKWRGKVRVEKVYRKKYLSCYLWCLAPSTFSGIWNCKAEFNVTLLRLGSNNQAPKYNKQMDLQTSQEPEDTNYRWWCWGFPDFIDMDDFLKGDYVKDNKAVIRFEVDAGSASGLHIVEKGYLSSTAVERRISQTLSLLQSGKGFNVTFVTKEGNRVKAHRDILLAGSPTLAAMLEPGCEVHLPDVSTACLQALLEHIYGAQLSKLDHSPLSLLQELIPVAHKYELIELKEYCGHLLVENWTPDKLFQMYKITRDCHLDESRMELEEVMKEHVGEVMDQMVAELRDADGDVD